MQLLLLAEWTGLEPATPGVTGRYSNQLNYHSGNRRRGARPGRYAKSGGHWWVLTGSNRRHSPCKGDALPAELSTHDPGRCEILTGAEAKFGCDRACLGQRGRECRSVRRRYTLLQPPAV